MIMTSGGGGIEPTDPCRSHDFQSHRAGLSLSGFVHSRRSGEVSRPAASGSGRSSPSVWWSVWWSNLGKDEATVADISVDWSRRSTVYGQTFGALICARSKHASVFGHQGPRPRFAMISPSRQASVIRTTQWEAAFECHAAIKTLSGRVVALALSRIARVLR